MGSELFYPHEMPVPADGVSALEMEWAMSEPTRVGFPEDFVWGVATSAAQIEGAAEEGGRGDSIWDVMCRQPGRIADGSDPSVACDHFHRWQEDLDHLAWLGVDSYRFSIAWPRVQPTGRGPVLDAGTSFYDRLVDGLLERGITPMVTLYHWDLPQALQDEGGWASRRTVDAFADYAAAMVSRLGDRVRQWITHNEPWCIATLGHEHGEQAPGHRDAAESLVVAHHVLLSHAAAMQRMRELRDDLSIGIVLNLVPASAATPSEADVEAVRRFDALFNRWYLDPLFRGRYPLDGVADRIRLGHLSSTELPYVQDGDLELIHEPLDFLGVNYYSRVTLKADHRGEPMDARELDPALLTDMGWEVHPDGLRELLVRVHSEYEPPRLIVTENGAAYSDGPDAQGRIHDLRRVQFLSDHIEAARRAIEDGVRLTGYYAWTLMDNFEWAHGYAKRFGLFWVDFETQTRTPKDSAHWYRRFLAQTGARAATSDSMSRRVS